MKCRIIGAAFRATDPVFTGNFVKEPARPGGVQTVFRRGRPVGAAQAEQNLLWTQRSGVPGTREN